MAVRRISTLAAAIALALSGLVVVAGPAAADGVLTVSATSVAVGGTLSVQPSGCDAEVEDDHGYMYQYPQITMVTGSGGAERAITVGGGGGGAGGVQFTVPGWVDPDEPAEVRGVCIEYRYHFDMGHEEEVELFSYPAVPIDITPAESGDLRTPTVALDRDTAAGGQVIVAHVSGCRPGEFVATTLAADTDLALTGSPRYVASGDAPAADAPSTRVEIPLLDRYDSGGPLAEGDYVLLAVCYSYDGDDFWMAEPTWVYVRGTSLIGSISVDGGDEPGSIVLTGDQCTAENVTIRLDGYETGLTNDPIAETLTVTPAPDGTWTATWSATSLGFSVQIAVDCGDPTADGYRYEELYWYENGFSDQWVGRISPTSSPVGGPVDVHVEGECASGDAVVQILGASGEILDEAPVEDSALMAQGRARVTAPAAPGQYDVHVVCGGRPGYPGSIEVFTPSPVADHAPLPPGPTTGWPETGPREVFNGLIGPISLPAEDHHEMPDMPDMPDDAGGTGEWDGAAAAGTGGATAAADLGPSGLGIPVPRPAGDFAITRLSVDLVDADGNPVSTDDAHLHHFVVADLSSTNPACPGSTFGLPGEIIAAAGAERTPIDFGDPYGLVVEESDPWAGVYELMSMAAEDQTVFLSYDMEIRRDVENVRPVRTYFGSATGCGSFTWTIDGSGTPDTQSHYLTIANDGVLVGAGGHLHNGGEHTELFNDRGRLLCRNELIVAGGHHGMGGPRGPGGSRGPGDPEGMTVTTVVSDEDDWPTDVGPPEMYDDDPAIESISPCRTHERVRAGERLRFTTTYTNERPRSGVMGIFVLYVWEGGGPATPARPRTDPSPRPGGLTDPVDPTEPTDPVGPTDPTDPTDPTAPTDPTSPNPPVDPSDPGPPTVPTSPTVPGRVEGASVRPAGAAPPAVPYRANAAYTG